MSVMASCRLSLQATGFLVRDTERRSLRYSSCDAVSVPGSCQSNAHLTVCSRQRRREGTRWRLLSLGCCKDETYGDVVTSTAVSTPIPDPNLLTQYNIPTSNQKLDFDIITVSNSDELLAAATLRAQLFYGYPEFMVSSKTGVEALKERLSHDFHVRDLLKKRIKSEFQRDMQICKSEPAERMLPSSLRKDTKMQTLDMKVKCLLAVCEESKHDEYVKSSRVERDNLFNPPPVGTYIEHGKSLVAIGTLDIQDGTGTEATVDVNAITFQLFNMANPQKKKSVTISKLCKAGPGHSLLDIASEAALKVEHGYIFNLCVTNTVRRQGVASALMKKAVQVAKQMQLQILYVHVEANNDPALDLYRRLGYVVEDEESVEVESKYFRPRRILLSYRFS